MYLFLTKKNVSKNSKITLAEKDEIVTDDSKIADTFNTVFCNFVKTYIKKKNEIFDASDDKEQESMNTKKCKIHEH